MRNLHVTRRSEVNYASPRAGCPINLGRHRVHVEGGLLDRQQQLGKAMFKLASNPTIKDATPTSILTQGFISFLEHELQKRVMDYYQPILHHCGFPTSDNKASIVELVQMVADVMKDSKERRGRSISMVMVIKAVCRRNNVVFHDRDPPVAVKQGMFSLLGLMTMLFEIPRDFSQNKLYISKPVNPVILYTNKPLGNTELALGILIASFGVL